MGPEGGVGVPLAHDAIELDRVRQDGVGEGDPIKSCNGNGPNSWQTE